VLAKSKQIVIDKEAFIRIGTDKLCSFAHNHLLLVCDTLLYECATTCESKRKDMLCCCDLLIKADAYYCPCSIGFLQFEGNNCCPYPSFLPDLNATEDIRKACLEDVVLNSPDKIKMISLSRWEVARNEFVKLSEMLKKRIDSENPDVGKRIKELPSDKIARLQKLFERIDKLDLHQTVVDSTPANWIKDESNFCLSPEWMSWQRIRLIHVMVMNYNYLLRTGGCPGDKRAEHDYQDMEYVLLLSRADGLLTKDDGCACLGKAAFPDKDVFRCIEDVPRSYKSK